MSRSDGIFEIKMGKIYILINSSMPGLVKIGHTQREAEERAIELSSATGVPTSFEIFRAYDVEESGVLERKIHRKLISFRVNGNREFFRIDAEDAAREIEDELPKQPVSQAEVDVATKYERDDELVGRAAELTKESKEIWPSKIAGALEISHTEACEIFRALKERGLVDKNGRCELFIAADRRKQEQEFQKDYEEAQRFQGRYRTKTALAYFLVVVGIAVAAESLHVGREVGSLVGIAVASFGLIVKFSVKSRFRRD